MGFITLMIILPACSTQKMAVRLALPLIAGQYDSIIEEADPQFAERAIPSSLKMMEGLLKSDPTNSELLLKLAEGFCNYSFGFVEDEDPKRASNFYIRGRDYAQSALNSLGTNDNLNQMNLDQLSSSLNSLNKDQIPALFWWSQCGAGWLLLNLDKLEALAAISKIEKSMDTVLKQDESFYFAGPHLFFGSFYGGRSKMLGGNPEKALAHFERGLELTQNKFLMFQIMYAKTYAVQSQNKEKFIELLSEVLKASTEGRPKQRLANQIAKIKAKKLLEKVDELF